MVLIPRSSCAIYGYSPLRKPNGGKEVHIIKNNYRPDQTSDLKQLKGCARIKRLSLAMDESHKDSKRHMAKAREGYQTVVTTEASECSGDSDRPVLQL